MKNQILTGHGSFETAYKIENYPWGYKLRTTMFIWVETLPKKGDRIVRQTIDPRTGKLCAPKQSTFSPIKWLYLDNMGHVQSDGVNIYTNKETVKNVIETIGIENLNKEQLKQYNALLGINEVKFDEFTGEKKKDFSVKWERETVGNGWANGVYNKGEKGKYNEVKITFDRPDGVSVNEIFEAMKTLDQNKLKEVFEIRESKKWGNYPGTVRICVRGGIYLGTVSEESYKNWLASDCNVLKEEEAI